MQTIQAPLQILCESAQELYAQVLQAICEGEEVSSVSDPLSVGSAWGNRERPTKELRYATLILENPKNRLIQSPTFRFEDVFPRVLLCTLSDEIDLKTISFYNPRAHEFSDDDQTISSNYGYRIRHLNETNQIEKVISQFKQDRNTRRAVIHVHAVSDSEIKYDPCIDCLHFLIRNGKLECQSFWRSENALTLLPTNLFEFTLLQELIASELDIPLGRYVHTVSSLHYYLEDQSKLHQTLDELRNKKSLDPMLPMTSHSLSQIECLRNFEKALRLQLNEGNKSFSELSPYWQNFAAVIAYSITKKLQITESMNFWKKTSAWCDLI